MKDTIFNAFMGMLFGFAAGAIFTLFVVTPGDLRKPVVNLDNIDYVTYNWSTVELRAVESHVQLWTKEELLGWIGMIEQRQKMMEMIQQGITPPESIPADSSKVSLDGALVVK